MSFLNLEILRDIFPQKNTKIGPEDTECVAFVEWLRKATRSGNVHAVWFHVPNEGRRSWKQGTLQRAKGLCPGTPDYIFIWEGGSLALEFKSPSGNQTKGQREFEKWCAHENIPYHLVRSSTQAKDLIMGNDQIWFD